MNGETLTLDELVEVVRTWRDLYTEADDVFARLPEPARALALAGPPEHDEAVRTLIPALALLHPKARLHAIGLLDDVEGAVVRLTAAAEAWADRVDAWLPGAHATEPPDRDARIERLEQDVEELRRALGGASSVLGLVTRISSEDDEPS